MKERKKKDENAPKRGLTAFLHYVQATRETYKKEHPELSHKEVISKLGDVWNHLNEKEKEPFNAKAQIDKEKYKNAKEEYAKTKNDAVPAKKKNSEEPALEKKIKKVLLFFFRVLSKAKFFFYF